MKNKLFLFLALIGMMLPQIVSAERFEVNGIYYYASGNNAEVEQAIQADRRIYYSGDVVIPSTVNYNGNTYNVTSIGNNAFLDCSNLTSVTIPNSVTSIRNSAFVGCSCLTSINIPSSVMSIGDGAFRDCTSLPVTNNIRYADCYAIEAVDKSLASYTFKEGTRFIGSSAFYDCSGLTSVTIPNSVTSIGACAFSKCSNLTSITIPNGVTSIGGSAFSGCSGLTSVTIPNSVTSIGSSAFSGCTSLPVINNIRYADCYAIEAVDKSLASYTFKEGTRFIGDGAFYDCCGLTSVTIPNSVTSIGSSAFSSCSGLTSVTIPNSVTSIRDYTFYGCSGLTSVTIPNSVTSIGDYAFRDCSSLTSITIPNSVTSIGYDAFYGCSKLTHIYIDDIADWCCSSICGSLMSYGSRDKHLYLNGTEITVLTIPDGVTSIGRYAFKGCSSLISVTIPNSVTSIGDRAFNGCSRMTSVTIGNGVTSIGNYGFSGCSGLTYVTIGENVRNIGDGAFYGCQNIETITSYAVIPPMCKENTFDSELFNKTNVYVPNAENTFARYLGNNVWGQFRYIYEKDLTGVDTPVMNSETQVSSLINLNGQYITNAQRGINLQKMSNGTTKKVLMR